MKAHATAEVHESANIGENLIIWANSEVRERVQIGNDVSIGRNVYIGPGVVIGDGVRIQNNACIYEPSQIGKNVFIGPNVVLTNDKNPRLLLSGGTQKINGNWKPQPVIVENNVSLGANTTCIAGVRIGAWSMVGASSVVTKDIPNYSLAHGNPAKIIHRIDEFGEKLSVITHTEFYSQNQNKYFRLIENSNLVIL